MKGAKENSAFMMMASVRRRLSDQGGVALLMVVFVLSVLTAMVLSFTDTTQKHLHLTQHYKNRLQAYATAQSGLQLVVSLLNMDAALGQQYDGYNSPWNCDSPQYKELAAPLLASVVLCNSSTIQPALVREYDPRAEEGAGQTLCPIIDENRKLSLFNLVQNPGAQNETTDAADDGVFERLRFLLEYLLTERDLAVTSDASESPLPEDPDLVPPISVEQAMTLAGYLVDWIDSPYNSSAGGYNPDRAEDSCPEDGADYAAKNGRLDTIDELALICGFRQMPRHVIEKLGRHLTVYELQSNINTATEPVLHALCAVCGDESAYRDIYDRLHPPADEQNPPPVIQATGDYNSILTAFVDTDVITCIRNQTVIISNTLRVGINGVVFSTADGSIEASFGLTTVVQRRAAQGGGQAAGLDLLYYREG